MQAVTYSFSGDPTIGGTDHSRTVTWTVADSDNQTSAKATSTVDVKYIGASYATGKDFTASTWTTNKAASFSLTEVVPGFAKGIAGMKVGGRREIVIPSALGYGASGDGSTIKPNETLVFVVDLESIG